MHLHLGTLYVVQLTTFSLLTLALLLMGLRYRQEQALQHWGVGGILAGVGMLLIALRPAIPAWLSIDVANIVLFFAIALNWSGALALEQRRVPWRRLLFVVGLASATLLLMGNGPERYEQRAMLYSASYILFNLLALTVFASSPHRQRLGYRLLSGVITLLLIGQAARITLAMSFTQGQLLASHDFVIANFVLIMLEFAKLLGFIFVCFEGLEIRLYQQAMRDPLTGLYNRRAFHDLAGKLLQQQAGQPVALLVLDLDHFKQVNDLHGHLAGDDVLTHFGALLRNRLDPACTLCARSGGEEFVILLWGDAAIQAAALAEMLRAGLAEHAIITDEGKRLQQTCSIGFSLAQAGQCDLRQLLTHADEALYQAKAQGRNRVCGPAGCPA